MADIVLQTADWKTEKHVPVIDAPDKIAKGSKLTVNVTVGKEIPHPNIIEHHIRSIEVYFLADGEKFPFQIARFELNAHGESTQGPNTSTVYSEPAVSVSFKTAKSGVIAATSYCNIHGIWKNTKEITVE